MHPLVTCMFIDLWEFLTLHFLCTLASRISLNEILFQFPATIFFLLSLRLSSHWKSSVQICLLLTFDSIFFVWLFTLFLNRFQCGRSWTDLYENKGTILNTLQTAHCHTEVNMEAPAVSIYGFMTCSGSRWIWEQMITRTRRKRHIFNHGFL